MLVAKKGVVVMVNYMRMFGFVEEENTKQQVFFHFNNYSPNYFDFGDGVVLRVATNFAPNTCPRKGDMLCYHSNKGAKGLHTTSWVYQIEHMWAEANQLRNSFLEERARPKTSSYRSYGVNNPPPPKPQPQSQPWWQVVLAIPVGVTVTRQMVTEQYRKLARILHPDHGGDHDEMVELNKAKVEAMKVVLT